MVDPSDPAVAVRWLRRVRWSLVVAELSLLVLSLAGLLHPLPLVPIGVTCGVLVLFDVAQHGVPWRRVAGRSSVGTHLALDLLALSMLVSSSPDAHQPMQVFFVVEPAVAATVLRPAVSMAAAVFAAALQSFALLAPAPRGGPELPHLASHVLLTGLACIATTGFVAQLAEALRARMEALNEAEAARSSTERLAALGTIAAGVAHELATPLGTVGVLADEVALVEISSEERELARQKLHGELRRCRDVLERLKTGPGDLDGRTGDLVRHVEAWLVEWQRAHPPSTRPELHVAPGLPGTVRGAGEHWRAALWTLLGNARRAGARAVQVRLLPGGPSGAPYVALVVEDDGCGLAPDTAARAGEPFFSAWSEPGQGLGLFAARTFARAVGGDLALEPRPGGGARAILRIPREQG